MAFARPVPALLGDYSMTALSSHPLSKVLADSRPPSLDLTGRRTGSRPRSRQRSRLPCGRRIVEATEEACWNTPVPWSKPEGTVRQDAVARSMRYRWTMAALIFHGGNRRIAETKVFRVRERFGRKTTKRRKDLENLGNHM